MATSEDRSCMESSNSTVCRDPNNPESDLPHMIGYSRSRSKLFLFYCAVVLSLGLLYLITHWKSIWRIKLTQTRCLLRDSDTVIVKDQQCNYHVEKVDSLDLDDISVSFVAASKLIGYEKPDVYSDDKTRLLTPRKQRLKYFDHLHLRFVWNAPSQKFVRLTALDVGHKCRDICERSNGLSNQERSFRQKLYGINSIEVEVKSYPKLFIEEVFNPFYVFQIFSVVVWYCDDYAIFASCIVVISIVSLSVELYETRKQREMLRDMVASSDTTVSVLMLNGVDTSEISTSSLVPGDVIVLPPTGCMMSCDAVLITGNAVVDEGMLTGESVPVTKTPLTPDDENEIYSPELHKRCTLFCGTQVIQTRFYMDARVKAVVVRTGFSTAKGELVRSILYPNQIFFKFYSDSLKFIAVLGAIAFIGCIYVCAVLIIRHSTPKVIILRALDVVTIAVPPSLPAAMTIGIIFAQARLKKAGIFCISPPRINLCAKIQCFCFDKTGTLTEDGLDLLAVIPVKAHQFTDPVFDPRTLPQASKLVIAMATCHSLTLIEKELKGDPLELKMFNSIDWILDEPGEDTCKFDLLVPTVVRPVTEESSALESSSLTSPLEVAIVRQFTFSSGLQRMSVIVRVLGEDHMVIYAKGSPEKIAALCLPETVPGNFHEVLREYASKGLRVIALATKSLDEKVSWLQVQRISRNKVESELRFLGLLLMENKVKLQTTPIIEELRAAKIRVVMVTGDNVLTAVSVARTCGMVYDSTMLITVDGHPPANGKPARLRWILDGTKDEEKHEKPALNGKLTLQDCIIPGMTSSEYRFALTGRSFAIIERYFPELMLRICLRGAVFARMTPDQKSKLIERLQELGYYVGMCGDGANDCGALRAAHAGISLSEAEASVASPFTSKVANISCVPKLLREGRAALVTSFCVFKYIALYSMVQFVSVLLLTSYDAKLSDFMFLYIDLVIAVLISMTIGHTAAYDRLVPKRPPSSLVSAASVISLIFHIGVVIGFQVLVVFYAMAQPGYMEPNTPIENGPTGPSILATVVFYVTSLQYLTLAFVLSRSHPYRQRIWTNVPFTCCLVILTILSLLIIVYPPGFISNLFELFQLESITFRLTLVGISACHFLIAYIFEQHLMESGLLTSCIKRSMCPKSRTKKSLHQTLSWQLDAEHSWPPVGQITYAKLAGEMNNEKDEDS